MPTIANVDARDFSDLACWLIVQIGPVPLNMTTPIDPPKVTASAVFVLNADTGQPLYHKNENQAVRILSITKLITAYVLVQRLGGQLSDAVTIAQAHLVSGASSSGLRKGDVWSLEDLLYGMLLVSGNDAALAIADHVGRTILAQEKKRGSWIKRFVQEMRSAAAALGARHTQFADPYGLSPSNVATAPDVGLMGRTMLARCEIAAVLAVRAANAKHRRTRGAYGYARQHHRDARRRRYHWGKDRIAYTRTFTTSSWGGGRQTGRRSSPWSWAVQITAPATMICGVSWRRCRRTFQDWPSRPHPPARRPRTAA